MSISNWQRRSFSWQEPVCKGNLNKNIYITLTDHLNFAIERHRKGIYFQRAVQKKFYETEDDDFNKSLVLKDESKANDASVEKIKAVKNVIKQGGQYQVVIGNEVASLFKKFKTTGKFTKESTPPQKAEGPPYSGRWFFSSVAWFLFCWPCLAVVC